MTAPILSYYYDLMLPKASGTVMKAKCKYCGTIISGRLNTSSNFITHTKRKHREIYQTLFMAQKVRPAESRPTIKVSTQVLDSQPVYVQQTDTLLKLIAADLLPISIVDSIQFHQFVTTLNPHYKLPTRDQINTKLLPELAASIQTLIRLNLTKAHSVCLSFSVASQEAKTLIGITAHYIIDWRLYSMVLSYTRLECMCNESILRQEYEQVVAGYEIAHKVISVVVYSSLNSLAPYLTSIPGFSTEENDNYIILRVEPLVKDSKPLPVISFNFLPRSSPCFVHSLHLIVRDTLNELSEPLRNAIHDISSTIQYLESLGHKIVKNEDKPNSTKWISQLDTIRTLLYLSEEEFSKLEISHFSKAEREMLLELCDILHPIEHALRLLQQHANVSPGFIIPVSRGIKHKLEQITPVHNDNVLVTVKKLVQERLTRYEQDDSYITASVLDPRFKLRWSNQDEQCKIKSIFLNKVSILLSCYATNHDDTNSQLTKSQKTEDDLFSFMTPTSSNNGTQLTTLEAETEVIQFLSQPCLDMEADPFMYWKTQQANFPLLAEMAFSYMAMPTSSPDEIVLNDLLKSDLSSLSYETFQIFVFSPMPILPGQAATSSTQMDEESAADFNQMMEYEESGISASSELTQTDKIIHLDFYNRFGDLCDDDLDLGVTTTKAK
ncbi:Zinc finger BED domain-containing protein 4-like [Oopsacas minuta]|uniref:Zinc finger BED domain-containing protein 4-like n=1 Tax=Oopsacas minuta TaxID=111878 RepID=A0AAV7JDT4_9METZ|nr:Zinc finger BED domain-containing protein 4-like [Oopsacas minuta]